MRRGNAISSTRKALRETWWRPALPPPVMSVSHFVSSARLAARAPTRPRSGSAAKFRAVTRAASGHCLFHAEGFAPRRSAACSSGSKAQGAGLRAARGPCRRSAGDAVDLRGARRIPAQRRDGPPCRPRRAVRALRATEGAHWQPPACSMPPASARSRAIRAHRHRHVAAAPPRLRDVLTTLAAPLPLRAGDPVSGGGAGRGRGARNRRGDPARQRACAASTC